jgi:hypothetical protein
MKRTILALGLLMALFALALTTPVSRKVTAAGDKGNGKGGGHTPVTICHHTGSQKNPIVVITVDDDAVPAHFANHGDSFFNPSPNSEDPCAPF